MAINANLSKKLKNKIENKNNNAENAFSKRHIFAYSIGHFYNDLCASMWFNYFLMYAEKVIGLPNVKAGILMNIGQITDALSTPLIGMLSDHSVLPATIIERFGRRKSWHAIGTLCVTLSFSLIFSGCFICTQKGPFWWFIAPIMLFQFGWASVQISHLAMIPDSTNSEPIRMSMTSFRYGFTVLGNIFVFSCLYLLLDNSLDTKNIGPKDDSSFRYLSLIVVGLGTVVTFLFYAFTTERSKSSHLTTVDAVSTGQNSKRMFWYSWFRQRHFYLVAVLYLGARVYININLNYFTFYIDSMDQPKRFVALLPLTVYVCSMVTSVVLGSSPVSKRANIKALFFVGAVLGILNCALIYFQMPQMDKTVILFINAACLGLTQALLLICSLKTTATLIRQNTESAAFVYGAMSFVDKLSNGLIVQVLEGVKPNCTDQLISAAQCTAFYRATMAFVPGICVAVICAILAGMNMQTIGQRKQSVAKIVENGY